MTQTKLISVGYIVAGYGLIALSLAVLGALYFGLVDRSWALPLLLLALVACFPAKMMLEVGSRHGLARAQEILAADTRPAVIYLRSFADETAQSSDRRFVDRLKFTIGYTLPGLDIPWRPAEQLALAKCLNLIGPYVAIGRPGEPLPEFGAARKYVGDHEWQGVVGGLIEHAAGIVLEAGRSDGLRWEIERVVLRAVPTKVLLVLPSWPNEYAAFRAWANAILPRPLPEEMPTSRLMTFAAGWQPHPLDASPRAFPNLLGTLRPFLQQNGIALSRWQTG